MQNVNVKKIERLLYNKNIYYETFPIPAIKKKC